MGSKPQAEVLIAEMETEIEAVRTITESSTDKKTVYFEIGAAPNMVSFGHGVFLHEMIELIGAENILADQKSWISVADEVILDANPDVILTSVDYIDDSVAEIKTRPGWDKISAVQNDSVFYIDTDASNRPSHHIRKALQKMALAIYPDEYRR
jgi:iron complex transport system substrate-binding protein